MKSTAAVRAGRLCVIGLVLCLLTGCASDKAAQMSGPNAEGRNRITEAELQEELNEFVDRFSGVVSASANEISASSPQRTVRKSALLWKLRMIPRLENMVYGADPQVAFLDAATLCVQMRKYLQGPDTDGATLFGDSQAIAIQAVELLENDIFRIGALFLNEVQLQTLRDEVDQYTSEHPIRGTFTLTDARSTTAKPTQGTPLDWVTVIPMAPFRALEGIDAGAQAIRDFNTTAGQFSQIVEDMPLQTRWQIELLWYELEERDSVIGALDSFKTIADSAASLSTTAETLPTRLREELAAATKDIEDSQAALQTTLVETRQTLDALNGSIGNATQMLTAVDQASGSVAQAGEAWRDALNVASDLAKPSDGPDDAIETKPFDINDYAQAADKLAASATELRILLAEARTTLESPALDKLSRSTLDDAEARGRSVTDHAAWRVLQLIGVVFILAIVYRLISQRLISRGKPA